MKLRTLLCAFALVLLTGCGGASASGIPFAYVVDHKGEVVWSGHPAQKAFDEAVRDALKALGIQVKDTKDGAEWTFSE